MFALHRLVFVVLLPQMRDTLLTFIIKSGGHQKLLKTKYFNHLKQLVASDGQPNQLKDLVDRLISQDR